MYIGFRMHADYSTIQLGKQYIYTHNMCMCFSMLIIAALGIVFGVVLPDFRVGK